MKFAGRAAIFEIGDMIGPDAVSQTGRIYSRDRQSFHVRNCRAVPLPFYDGWLARLRSAWEVFRGRAYPVAWPTAGDLETALNK